MAKRYYDEKNAAYGEMLTDDKSQIANMPQATKYVEYPKTGYYSSPELVDTIGGIDRQMNEEVRSSTLKKGSNPEKY